MGTPQMVDPVFQQVLVLVCGVRMCRLSFLHFILGTNKTSPEESQGRYPFHQAGRLALPIAYTVVCISARFNARVKRTSAIMDILTEAETASVKTSSLLPHPNGSLLGLIQDVPISISPWIFLTHPSQLPVNCWRPIRSRQGSKKFLTSFHFDLSSHAWRVVLVSEAMHDEQNSNTTQPDNLCWLPS